MGTDVTKEIRIPSPGRQLAGRQTWWYPVTKRKISTTDLYVTPSSEMVKYDYCHGENHPGPPYLEGSDLLIIHFDSPWVKSSEVDVWSKPYNVSTSGQYFDTTPEWTGRNDYRGSFFPYIAPGFDNLGPSEAIIYDQLTPSWVNDPDMSDLGSRAYNKLRPKIEDAGVFQTIFEWRDIPTTLKTTSEGFHDAWKALGGQRGRTLSPSGLANQFLNYQFGWRPFIKDLRQTFDVISNFRAKVSQLEKMNRTDIKRRWSEEVVLSDTKVYVDSGPTNFCDPSLGYEQINGNGIYEIRRQKMERVWYQGTFTMYLPEFDRDLDTGYQLLDDVNRMSTLLGANINPSNLYAVTPWSWLVDWFFGVGDNVRRWQDLASQRVVAKSVYLMRTAYERYEFRSRWTDGAKAHNIDLKWYRSVETKRRELGKSPFGFTRPPGGLSGTQLAILGSLGLTRLS